MAPEIRAEILRKSYVVRTTFLAFFGETKKINVHIWHVVSWILHTYIIDILRINFHENVQNNVSF